MATGCHFPGVKRGWSVTLTNHPHPMPMSRTSRSYFSYPPWFLHVGSGIALLSNLRLMPLQEDHGSVAGDYLQGQMTL
jgi:hypothetical protein